MTSVQQAMQLVERLQDDVATVRNERDHLRTALAASEARVAMLNRALIVSHAEKHGAPFGSCDRGECLPEMRSNVTTAFITRIRHEGAEAMREACKAKLMEMIAKYNNDDGLWLEGPWTVLEKAAAALDAVRLPDAPDEGRDE